MTPADPERSRAALALGLPADADGPAARRAFLRRLAGNGFIPPEDDVAAVNTLAGMKLPLTPDAEAERDARLRADVDAFAAEFWSLPPDVRLERWNALSDRNPDCRTAARLEHLARGLDAEVWLHTDVSVEGLAAVERDLFVLTPRARAVRRAEWIDARGRPVNHEELDQLRKHDPATSRLDPILFDLADRAAETHLSRRWNVPADPTARQTVEVSSGHVSERELDEASHARRKRQSEKQASFNRGAIFIAIFVVIGLLKGIALTTSRTRTDPPATRTQYNRPLPVIKPSTRPPWPRDESKWIFTPEEVEEFRKYDPRSGKPAPPGYGEWILRNAGRWNELDFKFPNAPQNPPVKR